MNVKNVVPKWSAAAVVSAIIMFYALFNAGILDPFNKIIWWEYTFNQLIFLVMVIVGLGAVVVEIYSGARKPADFIRDTSQYLGEVLGMSQNEVSRFENDMGQQMLKKVHAVLADGSSTTVDGFPSPDAYLTRLRENFKGYAPALVLAVVAQGTATGEINPDAPLDVIPARVASSQDVELVSDYSHRRTNRIIAFLVIAVILFIIGQLLTRFM